MKTACMPRTRKIEPRINRAWLSPLQRLYNHGLPLAGADETRIEMHAQKIEHGNYLYRFLNAQNNRK